MSTLRILYAQTKASHFFVLQGTFGLSYALLSWAIYVKFLPGLNKITYPVKNPVHVQIFQALQCHDNVALDVCGSQNNTCVFNDNLMSILFNRQIISENY